MTPDNIRNSLWASGMGSAVAAAALAGMAVLPRPVGQTGHFDIFAGIKKLTPAQLDEYIRYLYANFTLDSVYLLGHIGMWLGLALIIWGRSRLLAAVLAGVGLMSGLSDFLENEIRLAIVSGLENQLAIGPHWAMIWSVVVGISIWLIYAAAALAAIGMWRRRPFGWLVALFGALGVATIPFSLLWGWSKVWYVWLIVWHLLASVVLFWEARRDAALSTDLS